MQMQAFHLYIIAFATGVVLETVFNFVLPEIVWVFFLALAILAISYKKSFIHSKSLLTTSLCILFLAVGLLRTESASWAFNNSPLESNVGEKVALEGIVIREPEVREKTTHLYVAVADDVLLVTTERYVDVSYGDSVSIKGELQRPTSFVSDLGREFNYPGYLLARGVEYRISFAQVATTATGSGNRIVKALLQFKHALMNSIESVIPEPQAGLGEGLLLGVKQALGADVEAAFRTTGIIHIIVLSGYNVMLVVAFVMFILSFFLSKRRRLFVGLLAIIGFAIMVGLSATVVRASIMASLLLIAATFGRTYDISRALLLAGAVMVFINPYILVYDIGFQFSFMATVGLILIAPRFETLFLNATPLLSVKEYVIATIATQIAVLPLLLYYIGEVSLIAVVVNVLVLPMVPLAMLTTFLAGMVGMFSSTLAIPFGFVAHLFLTYILEVAILFAALPFASVVVGAFPLIGVFVLYGIIGFAVLYFKNKNQSKIVQNDLNDWTVEAETESVGAEQSSTPTDSTTPIFFR